MVALPSVLHSLFALATSTSLFLNPFGVIHATNCDVSKQAGQIDLPPNQNQLVLPTTTTPTFVGLAFGVQNYTCTSGNNFTCVFCFFFHLSLAFSPCHSNSNVGAVAELIDVSCLAGSSGFLKLPDTLFAAWSKFEGPSIQEIILDNHLIDNPDILAQHYFITNPQTGQGLSPKWDFTSSGKFEGNQDAFVVVKAKGSLPAPTDPKTDVNWLDVVNIEGKIADEVFRTDTRGGQPPSSVSFSQFQICTRPGIDASASP